MQQKSLFFLLRHILAFVVLIFVKKTKAMNDYLFLTGLTVTLLAGSYFVKSMVMASVQVIKGILNLFD